MIDYLGQLLGVSRLARQGAVTTLQFTLQNALTLPYTIPAGTQGGTIDGQFVFATGADLIVPAATTVASITATCTTAGPNANGYLPGQVNVLLSPNVLIASVSNTVTTGGGSAPETDDHLRTRIQAAPNQFSVAGPAGAYRFFALGVVPLDHRRQRRVAGTRHGPGIHSDRTNYGAAGGFAKHHGRCEFGTAGQGAAGAWSG